MVISGNFVTKRFTAEIQIEVHPYFRRFPPSVFCNEKWIRKEADWHCSRYGGLCWILADQWKDSHSSDLKSWEKVIYDGINLWRNDVEVLLRRHWIGDKRGIKKWRTEWTEWPHEEAGTNLYKKQIEEFGKPYNWDKKIA